jgi:hypothetical protein
MSPEDNDLADREFERRAADELKRGIEATPPEIRARLDRLVVRALQTPARSRVIRYGLPAGVVAALSAVIVALQFRAPVTPAPAAQAADDLALLLNADNLDLLEQMEFYRWLEQQPGMLDDALAASSAPAQRS